MATVSGITVARAKEIEDRSVVSGAIVGSNLYLRTFAGQQINAGVVVPNIPPLVAAWPVGSIFISIRPDNPGAANMLGGGTWSRWGQGKVPVSIDANQAEFATVEGTAGNKYTTLTTAEMPKHSHGTWTGTESAQHIHGYFRPRPRAIQAGGTATLNVADSASDFSYTDPESAAHAHQITEEGGGASFSNMMPYINVYMWKRTA